MLAAASSMNGDAHSNTLALVPGVGGSSHTGSRNAKVAPRCGRMSRFHIKPALIYKIDDAAMLVYQVMG